MPSELARQPRSLVVIGDPLSRRSGLIRDAGQRIGCAVTLLSYHELVCGGSGLDRIPHDSIVRLDSPGNRVESWRHIMQAGIEPLAAQRRVPLSAEAIENVTLDRGEILHPRQWFLGLKQLLQQLDADVSPRGVQWMNSPESVITSFDKDACKCLWQRADLPVAGSVPNVETYAQLREAVPDRHARLFIKLRYGYSAMGAIALEWRGDLIRAITTVETTWSDGRSRLFLSKRPRVLQHEFEIAWLIDTLGMEHIVVEDWLPKARWQGKSFDLRVVVIDGQARHVVGRASGSPFTNLNLDGDRIARDDVAELLGEHWASILELAELGAAEIRGASSLGMDVLVRPCRRRAVLLEANAFGDYLPGLLHDGQTTYELEINEFLRRCVGYTSRGQV